MMKEKKLRLYFILTIVCSVLGIYLSYNIIKNNTVYVRNRSESKLNRQKPEARFHKWIVITSINWPTNDVKFLSTLPGWRVVVVGDVSSPKNWSYPNCEFLSIAKQKMLGFKIERHLRLRSYARKNIGYLYAILNGAKFIYETDDDNRPLDHLKNFIYNQETSGLMFAGKHVFNPYPHFGQSTLWPRGYPLSQVGVPQNRTYWIGSEWTTPTIQQGVVDGDPDMDAIFRLTRKSVTSPLNVTFDHCAPPVIVPQGVFSPFNSQNTFFHHRAFWALLIPTTTTFRMCDIWRGYWAQRLMWEIGDRLAFFPANAYQNRSVHSYMEDAEDEKDMYFQTETLISFLANWICPASHSFFQCVHQLTTDMAEAGYWKMEEMEITQSWLDDLLSIGYTEPSRKTSTSALSDNKTLIWNRFQEDFYKTKNNRSLCKYVPAEQEAPTVNVVKDSTYTHERALKSFTQICPNLTDTIWKFPSSDYTIFSDVLLVITFNFPKHYKTVYYLEGLYRHIFSNIIYCGDNAKKFFNDTKDTQTDISFIEVSVEKGHLAYLCAIRAMEVNYKVKGYLIVMDDMLFKPWSLFNTSRDHFWVTQEWDSPWLLNITNPKHKWVWWEQPNGKEALDKTFDDIKNSTQFQENMINSSEFFAILSKFNKHPDLIEFGLSDLYYIPATRRQDTIWYMSKFFVNRVFLELAVPVIIRGLEPKSSLVLLRGQSLWGRARGNVFRVYPNIRNFFHPMKFSDMEVVRDVCKFFVPDILTYCFNGKQVNITLA